MFYIRLKPEVEKRLCLFAKETGRTKTLLARKLIEENLEEPEDQWVAARRLGTRGRTYTSAQVRRGLGLDE